MLTVDDIRNPKRKSGFNHVNTKASAGENRKKPWHAEAGRTKGTVGPAGGRAGWRWVLRETAEEAALDYCDYMNGDPIPMTRSRRTQAELDAFRATLTKTLCACGHFDVMARDYYEGSIAPGTQGKWETCVECYRELERERQRSYRGGTDPALEYKAPSVDMGTSTQHAPDLPPIKVIRPVFNGPHDLYDVVFYDEETGCVVRRKVGITARGEKRYADVAKTLGLAIRPYSKAITYPSKPKAEAAERARVKEIALTDKKWRRVAKEAFAPVLEGN